MNGRTNVVNGVGALGYISCLLQWLWTVVLYLPSVLDSKTFKLLLPQAQSTERVIVMPSAEPSITLMVIAVITTVVVLVVTIYTLFKLPVMVAKTGKKLTQKSAEFVIPIVTHHAPLTKKSRRLLNVKLIRIAKLLLIVLPMIGLIFVSRATLPVPYDIVLMIGACLAGGSLIWFSLQLLISWILKVPAEKVW